MAEAAVRIQARLRAEVGKSRALVTFSEERVTVDRLPTELWRSSP